MGLEEIRLFQHLNAWLAIFYDFVVVFKCQIAIIIRFAGLPVFKQYFGSFLEFNKVDKSGVHLHGIRRTEFIYGALFRFFNPMDQFFH